jgi:hypothetical protein
MQILPVGLGMKGRFWRVRQLIGLKVETRRFFFSQICERPGPGPGCSRKTFKMSNLARNIAREETGSGWKRRSTFQKERALARRFARHNCRNELGTLPA